MFLKFKFDNNLDLLLILPYAHAKLMEHSQVTYHPKFLFETTFLKGNTLEQCP
jgi:hypothetical protein